MVQLHLVLQPMPRVMVQPLPQHILTPKATAQQHPVNLHTLRDGVLQHLEGVQLIKVLMQKE
jgi:hypothetical protein